MEVEQNYEFSFSGIVGLTLFLCLLSSPLLTLGGFHRIRVSHKAKTNKNAHQKRDFRKISTLTHTHLQRAEEAKETAIAGAKERGR